MPTLEGADKGFSDSVNRLMSETGVTLTSGYRSNAEQQSLYDAALTKYGSEAEARKWAAKPGGSNHEHGVAADIGNYQKITDAQLAQYGLWRPMSWEPWHVEPLSTQGKRRGAASTTPPGVDPVVAKTMENFEEAIMSLTVGAQDSLVGASSTSVGAQVGIGTDEIGSAEVEDGQLQPQMSTKPNTASSTPANESAYADLFNAAGTKYGINPKLLQEVARQESGFNTKAKNASGATGLMQIMPGTAAGLGVDATDPAQSVDGAARLLSGYMKQYNGDLSKALAAYNAGPGAVARYGGVPPYKETQHYVKTITEKVGS